MSYLSGNIFDLIDNQPLADVGVWTESFATGSYGETISDSAGFYLIEPIDPGPGYFLAAKRDDYSRRVFEDGVIPYYGLEQDIGTVRTGAISGNVIESVYGQRVSGANVYFAQLDEPTWGGGETVTDASGNFYIDTLDVSSLTNVSGSNYSLLVVPPEYSYVADSGFIPPHYTPEDVVLANYIVEPRAVIVGTVTSGGVPLSGATAYLYASLTGLLLDTGIAVTNAFGSFTISVNASESPTVYRMVVQGTGTEVKTMDVAVWPGTVTPLSISLAGPGSISGTVTDLDGNSISEAVIVLALPESAGPVMEPVVAGADGIYTLSIIPPRNDYVVRLYVPMSVGYILLPPKENVSVVTGINTIINLQEDIISPTSQILSPTAASIVSGSVDVIVKATDNQSVGTIILNVGNEVVDSNVVSDPFNEEFVTDITVTLQFDSSVIPNGDYDLKAYTYGICGNEALECINITINN